MSDEPTRTAARCGTTDSEYDVRSDLPGTVEFLNEYADRLDIKGYPVHAQEIRKIVRWALDQRSPAALARAAVVRAGNTEANQ